MTITLLYPVFRQVPITQKYRENPGNYTAGCTPDGSHNGVHNPSTTIVRQVGEWCK